MAWYILFFVTPIALVVWYSFGAKDTTSTSGVPVDMSAPSLANYRTAFSDTFFTVFAASIRIAVVATVLCLVIGLPVAYFMAFKVSERWRGTLLGLVVIPSFASFLMRTAAWRIPLSANGQLSTFLQDIGLRDGPLAILDTRPAVQIAIIYNYLGFMILPLFVAFDRLQAGLRDASKDLGAGRTGTLAQVTVPLALPGIAAGVLLTYIPMCGDYLTADVLGGNKGFMIGSLVESNFRQAQDWPLGSAMAVLLILAVLLTLGVGAGAVWLLGLLVRPHLARLSQLSRGVAARRDVRRLALATWTTIVIVFLFLPLLLIIRNTFTKGRALLLKGNGYTTKWWSDVFDGAVVWPMLIRSVGIIAVAMIVGRVGDRPLNRRGRSSAVMRRWAMPVGVLVAVVVNGLATGWYHDVFDNRGIGDAMRNSFIAAFGATIIAVLLGGMAGVALAKRSGLWSKPFMALLFLVLVTPEIMVAIALLGWLVRLGDTFSLLDNGYVRLWIGQSLYSSAVVTLIVRARLAGLDASLEEAADDLGATPGRAFRQITLPLAAPALAAGALLSFALCLDNTIVSSFVSTAGTSTYPPYVLGSIRTTLKPSAGAGAMVLFAITLASLTYLFVVLRRSGESSASIATAIAGG